MPPKLLRVVDCDELRPVLEDSPMWVQDRVEAIVWQMEIEEVLPARIVDGAMPIFARSPNNTSTKLTEPDWLLVFRVNEVVSPPRFVLRHLAPCTGKLPR